jgi:hypothetical protein
VIQFPPKRPPPYTTLGAISAAVGPAANPNHENLSNGLTIPPGQQNVVSFTFTTSSSGLVFVIAAMSVETSNPGDTVFFIPIRGGSAINLGIVTTSVLGTGSAAAIASGTVIALVNVGVGFSGEFGVQAINDIPGHTVTTAPGRAQVIIIEL